ncbi:MAG: hypothetical protein IPM26_06410 [Saprospiraceae bacterium]|nr:hypothetical protein [Saprospiraceae bacterium]
MKHFIEKQYIIAICTLLAVTWYNPCTAQNTALIDKLKTALFPQNQDSVLLIDYLKKCRNHLIDSSIYIRKNQPNYNQVMNVMEEILHTGDTSLMTPLMMMYDDFVDIFEKEWQKVNKDNIYPCDSVRNQINIMEGFERILKGLYIRHFTAKEKFDFFYNQFLLVRGIHNDKKNRATYTNQWLIFNKRYRKLIEPAWFQGYTPFYYIDPYIDEIAPFVIKKIEENKVIPYFASDEERFLFSNYITIAKIKNPAMVEALKEVLRHDTLGNKTNTWTFVHYLAKNHDDELVELVIEKLAKDFPEMPDEKLRDYFSRTINNHILKVAENESAVLKALVKLAQKGEKFHDKALLMIDGVGTSMIKKLILKNQTLPKTIVDQLNSLIVD